MTGCLKTPKEGHVIQQTNTRVHFRGWGPLNAGFIVEAKVPGGGDRWEQVVGHRSEYDPVIANGLLATKGERTIDFQGETYYDWRDQFYIRKDLWERAWIKGRLWKATVRARLYNPETNQPGAVVPSFDANGNAVHRPITIFCNDSVLY